MKRPLNRVNPHRLVETEFTPGGFGSNYPGDQKPRKTLVAHWAVADDGQLICQWVPES